MNYKNLNKHANIISISVSAASTTKNSESRFRATSCHNTEFVINQSKVSIASSVNNQDQDQSSGCQCKKSNVEWEMCNVKYQVWNVKCQITIDK